MGRQKKIISECANGECQRISTSAIRQLQKSKYDSLLSGDDSCLTNTWDEICVQIQGERSFFWDAYLSTIQHIVETGVDKLGSEIQMGIWSQIEHGYLWNAEEEREPESIFDDVVHQVMHCHLFIEAAEWSNLRIEQYMERN